MSPNSGTETVRHLTKERIFFIVSFLRVRGLFYTELELTMAVMETAMNASAAEVAESQILPAVRLC